MKKISLLASNSYLKDRESRDRLLRRTVLTSSAVEGVGKPAARALGLDQKWTTPNPVVATVPEQP